MGEYVSILEGQSSKQFNNVNYLRTSLQGGGYCDWIPEQERELTDRTFIENGTYHASDFTNDNGKPYWGMDEVTVDVPKDEEKEGTDKDGESTHVKRDDNGNLVKTKLPHHIAIVTNPSKMTYNAGESINMSGAVVKAYKKNGSIWTGEGYSNGVIPNSELILNPTKAPSFEGTEYSNNNGINAMKISIAPTTFTFQDKVWSGYAWGTSFGTANGIGGVYPGTPAYLYTQTQASATLYITQYNGHLFLASADGVAHDFPEILVTLQSYNGQPYWYGTLRSGETSNKFAFCCTPDAGSINPAIPVSTVDPSNVSVDNLTGSGTIQVSWKRPKDKKKLSTSFNINVTGSSSGSGSGSGGGDYSGGGGAGGGGGGSW